MGPLGVPELIFIFILALLVFGPRKLPELGRTLGKAMTEFRRASNELRGAVEDEMRTLEREGAALEQEAASTLDSGESSIPAHAPPHVIAAPEPPAQPRPAVDQSPDGNS